MSNEYRDRPAMKVNALDDWIRQGRQSVPIIWFVATLFLVGVVQAELPQYQVNHPPYLQLGNARLGDNDDQMEIWWQTIPAGPGNQDVFEVEYRLAGVSDWEDAVLNVSIHTGVEERINHSTTISDLRYGAEYEYRVSHWRADQLLGSYQNTFQTRLAADKTAPFSFVTYGDSADLSMIENFRSVQNQINQLDATTDVAFSLLLGDNAYPLGRHGDYDARLDATDSPQHVHYAAQHIDYAAIGNHDVWDGTGGQPFRDNFSVPRNGPRTGEWPEHNFSFDYGSVHFTTFDSNSLTNPERLENQLDWLVADLEASDAPWKIVFAHHPMAGAPDKSQKPADNYYQQVVSKLREANADLFLVGHSHTYHRTYPLLGVSNSQAVFLQDEDDDYSKSVGLIQLTSGVGGRNLRSGSFVQFPFNAAGFSTSTQPAAELGFTQIDVTQHQLTMSYIGASEGEIKDSFTITNELDKYRRWSAATAEANWSEVASWAPAEIPDSETIVTVENTKPGIPIDSVVDTNMSVDVVLVRGRQARMSLHIPQGVILKTQRGLVLDPGAELMGTGNIVGNVNNIAGRIVVGAEPPAPAFLVPEPGTSLLIYIGLAIGLVIDCRTRFVSRSRNPK